MNQSRLSSLDALAKSARRRRRRILPIREPILVAPLAGENHATVRKSLVMSLLDSRGRALVVATKVPCRSRVANARPLDIARWTRHSRLDLWGLRGRQDCEEAAKRLVVSASIYQTLQYAAETRHGRSPGKVA